MMPMIVRVRITDHSKRAKKDLWRIKTHTKHKTHMYNNTRASRRKAERLSPLDLQNIESTRQSNASGGFIFRRRKHVRLLRK